MSNQDRIEKALSVANQTKALAVGPNIIGDVGAMFKEQFPGRKAIIISNDSTYEKVGVMVAEALTAAGVEQDEPFIFTDPNLYAEFTYVLQLDACLSRTRAIPIAVGAGTINDLTKICSYRNGKRYMCVATAASMDGYAAYGASITYNGEKKDFECPAPKAILADTAIIAQAPSSLTAAGYADDSYINSNAYANRDILFAFVRQLGKNIVPMEIDFKVFASEQLDITTSEAYAWTVTMVAVFPALVCVTGGVVCYRRKHK